MSETNILPELLPGAIIQVPELRHLTVLEDGFAASVAPDYDQALWACRQPKLRDAVVPRTFNGRLLDIELQVMDEPAARLLDARDRGWRLPNVNMAAFTSENSKAMVGQCLGFCFSAVVSSIRQRNLGPLQAEVWYVPATFSTVDSDGIEVRTVVTAPQYETQRLQAMQRSSKRFGAIAVSKRCTPIPKQRTGLEQ